MASMGEVLMTLIRTSFVASMRRSFVASMGEMRMHSRCSRACFKSMGEMHVANMPSRKGFQEGNEPHAEQMQQGMTLGNRCPAEDCNH